MTDVARLCATVHGLVQGVYFRYFVQTEARRLGLTGYVRNIAGGAVEIEAEGAKQQLDELLEHVRIGPPQARVERMKVDWSDYSGHFDGFTIRY